MIDNDDVKRCLTALYLEVPEAVALDVARIINGRISFLTAALAEVTRERDRLADYGTAEKIQADQLYERATKAESVLSAATARLAKLERVAEKAEALIERHAFVDCGNFTCPDTSCHVIRALAELNAKEGQHHG